VTGAIVIGNSRKTTSHAVTETAATFTPATKCQRYVVSATVDVQLKINGTADATCFYLNQGSYVEVKLLPGQSGYGFIGDDGDTLSYICATDADDGTIFITEVGG
jgi:hypothetical protein